MMMLQAGNDPDLAPVVEALKESREESLRDRERIAELEAQVDELWGVVDALVARLEPA